MGSYDKGSAARLPIAHPATRCLDRLHYVGDVRPMAVEDQSAGEREGGHLFALFRVIHAIPRGCVEQKSCADIHAANHQFVRWTS